MGLGEIVSHLGSAGVAIPLVSAAMGGAFSLLKVFLPSEYDIEDRIELQRSVLREQVAQSYEQLLDALLEKPSVSALRGNPPREADLIADNVGRLFATQLRFGEFRSILRTVRRCYSALFVTFILAVAGSVVALAWAASRPVVSAVAVVIIVIQILVAYVLRRQAGRVRTDVRSS